MHKKIYVTLLGRLWYVLYVQPLVVIGVPNALTRYLGPQDMRQEQHCKDPNPPHNWASSQTHGCTDCVSLASMHRWLSHPLACEPARVAVMLVRPGRKAIIQSTLGRRLYIHTHRVCSILYCAEGIHCGPERGAPARTSSRDRGQTDVEPPRALIAGPGTHAWTPDPARCRWCQNNSGPTPPRPVDPAPSVGSKSYIFL